MHELKMFPEPPTEPPVPGAVILGRFQPFHRGHESMLEFAERWRLANRPDLPLVIAIGSSNRPESLRNPWSYQEREEMIGHWVKSNDFEATPKIISIPDIDDLPNWVSHAESYHGEPGIFLSSDIDSLELYSKSNWPVVEIPLEKRERLEGWRVRETARMMSTIDDASAVSAVLSPTIPESVISFMIENGYLRRLAFLGEGGEPVG
tara:strand:+ start:2095 stop:2712 length:618 start_codon:yes stop_codon:yes gene_type:complete